MLPCEYPNCRKPGQKHHIVFRSQGGMNINVNYKYLCAEHHTGSKAAVHNNREYDLQLKREMQDRLFKIFNHDTYSIDEIAEKIGYDKRRLEKRFKTVSQISGRYKREDIVRHLMGDRLY